MFLRCSAKSETVILFVSKSVDLKVSQDKLGCLEGFNKKVFIGHYEHSQGSLKFAKSNLSSGNLNVFKTQH